MLEMAEDVRIEQMLRVVFARDTEHEQVRRGALAPPRPAHRAEEDDRRQDDQERGDELLAPRLPQRRDGIVGRFAYPLGDEG